MNLKVYIAVRKIKVVDIKTAYGRCHKRKTISKMTGFQDGENGIQICIFFIVN